MGGGGKRKRPGTPRSQHRVRRPRVLVVDDFADDRDMYMEYFRFVGFDVVGAADGETAIELAARTHPSVIIMDLSLPKMNGWEATRALKRDPETSDILIVAVTGHGEEESRRRAIDAGCDLFIVKPCLPADIGKQVLRLLDGSVIDATSTRVGRSDRRK